MLLATAREISEAISRWDGIEIYDQWSVPTFVAEPIPGLPIYADGIRCLRGPQCEFVARTVRTIDSH
jgi:hypothetical protein